MAQPNTISAQFQVSYQYDVLMTEMTFSPNNSTLIDVINNAGLSNPEQKVFCIIDEGITRARPDYITEIKAYFEKQTNNNIQCHTVTVAGGEACKTQFQIDCLVMQMQSLNLDRQSWVVVIGGGALLDCAGYASAIFHRGIRLIRMPSTVLAQNDAGIGVKNGINAFKQKNFLGTFAPPHAVINDFDLLTSLSERDKRAGLAEAVKVALIKDGPFFDWLELNAQKLAEFEENVTQEAIVRCAQCHISHITEQGDPFERGNGRPLDFGHWSAHKIENLANYEIRHGEAVAIGILLDTYYAEKIGMLSSTKVQRIVNLIETFGFSSWHDTLSIQNKLGEPLFLQGLEDFRQHLGGELSIPVLTDIGQYKTVHSIDQFQLLHALDTLKINAFEPVI